MGLIPWVLCCCLYLTLEMGGIGGGNWPKVIQATLGLHNDLLQPYSSMSTKQCRDCQLVLDVADFYLDARTRNPMCRCKTCHYNKNAARRATQPYVKREYKASYYKPKYYANLKSWRERNREEFNRRDRIYHQRRSAWFKEGWSFVLQRYGARCVRCHAAEFEIDHIRPVAQGGTNDPWNLQPLCHACNMLKRGTWKDFRPDLGAWVVGLSVTK